MAPFVVAANRGLFATEGLNVSTNSANGSIEAIAKVASGDSDMALVDINELIRWRDKPGAPAIKAVFMLFNQAPYAFVARKSRGIRALADLAGKTSASPTAIFHSRCGRRSPGRTASRRTA